MFWSKKAQTHGLPTGSVRSWFGANGYDRGQPPPLAGAEMRETFEHIIPFGTQQLKLTMPYDRGAAAYAYQGGRLHLNPIGNGIPVLHPISQPFSMMTGEAQQGTIFWSSQTINDGIQPELGPLYDPAALAALMLASSKQGY